MIQNTILSRYYPILQIFLIFVYGCQQTADRSYDKEESVSKLPVQTESPPVEKTAIDDSLLDDDHIPRLISAKVLQDTMLKTIALKKDSLKKEEVTLSVLTTAGRAPDVEENIIIRMYNYTTDTLMTGISYRVEFLDNGNWVLVSPPKNVGHEDIGHILYPFIARDFPILLFPDRNTYRPGKYRVIKPATVFNNSRVNEKKDISVEFEIDSHLYP